jgi:F0F1-type ATP synthase assembly protein I
MVMVVSEEILESTEKELAEYVETILLVGLLGGIGVGVFAGALTMRTLGPIWLWGVSIPAFIGMIYVVFRFARSDNPYTKFISRDASTTTGDDE